jgi:recombination protein RecA
MFEKFKKEFNKASVKAGIPIKNPPPTFFIDSGSVILNKIISGHYDRGWAQGRLGAIGGPSGSGKSFLIGNGIKAAQDQGCAILILDSENAMDDDYLQAIGVDTDADNFFYRSVTTIEQAVNEMSTFTKMYREYKMTDKVFIAVDSIDMLMTNSQVENYAKGETKGDQGQAVKQMKDMLKSWTQDLKTLPFVMVCAKQVYSEQDRIAKLVEPYVFTEGLKFAFSQILMITKLMLKADDVDGEGKGKGGDKYAGIWLKARGFKTRFTKPFQQAKIQVPYETGMDRYSGIYDVAVATGLVTKGGAYSYYKDKQFYKKDFGKYAEEVLAEMIAKGDSAINLTITEDEAPADGPSKAERLLAKNGLVLAEVEDEE